MPFPLRVPGTLFSVLSFPARQHFRLLRSIPSQWERALLLAKFNSGSAIPPPRCRAFARAPRTIYNDIEPTRIFRYSYSGRKVSAIIHVINEGTTAFSGIIAPPDSATDVRTVQRISRMRIGSPVFKIWLLVRAAYKAMRPHIQYTRAHIKYLLLYLLGSSRGTLISAHLDFYTRHLKSRNNQIDFSPRYLSLCSAHLPACRVPPSSPPRVITLARRAAPLIYNAPEIFIQRNGSHRVSPLPRRAFLRFAIFLIQFARLFPYLSVPLAAETRFALSSFSLPHGSPVCEI